MKHRDEIEEFLADIIDTYIDDEGNVIELSKTAATPIATTAIVNETANYHIFHSADIAFTPEEIEILGLTPVHMIKE